MELGSGKVAGKVLIVDHMLCYAKLLILVDSVTLQEQVERRLTCLLYTSDAADD